MKHIIVLGGDGFCGWPTALHLSNSGYSVHIVDNLSRRDIDQSLGCNSLTPIASIEERLSVWKTLTGKTISFSKIDIATEYEAFKSLLQDQQPHAIVHFAEQRAAPYSMKSATTKRYTVNNNVNVSHNLLCALAELGLDSHIVHLGTMGVYGYGTADLPLPEGYIKATLYNDNNQQATCEMLYPTNPGSIYHMTKCLDQEMFKFYAKNDRLRITDLHQGIVWGTMTAGTALDERLINRFDYDGDYGTVLNRFLVQAAIGYPLTVHGNGGQTRAFININDSVNCIQLAIENPPQAGDKPLIFNQQTETHTIIDLANLIAAKTGATIQPCTNPRQEAKENQLLADNQQLLQLGLEPIKIEIGLLEEVCSIVKKYQHRIDPSFIPCQSAWNRERAMKLAETTSV